MPRNAIAKEVQELRPGPTLGAGEYILFYRNGKLAGLNHGCPCGCGLIGAINFRGAGLGYAEWDVAGEWPNVTLSPSIGFYGKNTKEQGFHWHGHLTKGFFEEC